MDRPAPPAAISSPVLLPLAVKIEPTMPVIAPRGRRNNRKAFSTSGGTRPPSGAGDEVNG